MKKSWKGWTWSFCSELLSCVLIGVYGPLDLATKLTSERRRCWHVYVCTWGGLRRRHERGSRGSRDCFVELCSARVTGSAWWDDVAGPRGKVSISGSYVMVRIWSTAVRCNVWAWRLKNSLLLVFYAQANFVLSFYSFST
jgi:hypothetical protein